MDRDSGSSHSSNIHNRESLVCMGYVDTGDGVETDFGVSEKQKQVTDLIFGEISVTHSPKEIIAWIFLGSKEGKLCIQTRALISRVK